MKRYAGMTLCAVLAAAAILGVAAVAEADFLITLRNGGEITVRRYEEVGNQIVYKRFGGKIGIPKTHVATILNLETGEKQAFNDAGTAQKPKASPRTHAQDTSVEDLHKKSLTLLRQGRYVEAAQVSRETLKLAESTYGPHDPRVAVALNNLAAAYKGQGRYAEAEGLYKRALAIAEKSLGPNHPHVAAVLENMADLYGITGRIDKAKSLDQRARGIRSRNQ